MPNYRILGEVPKKRHIRFDRPKSESFLGEGLAYEHIVTTEGFNRAYSILYHLRPPTRIKSVELLATEKLIAITDQPLRHHHLQTQKLPRQGDPIHGRTAIMFNENLVAYRVLPDRQQSVLYRNASADEVIFIQQGTGVVESAYGRLRYRRGDYVVIPRTTTYQIISDQPSVEDHLVLECFGAIRIPQRYLNSDGQLLLGSPYYERDFHSPYELAVHDLEGEFPIEIKDRTQWTRVVSMQHPFDVIGWDGFVYPYTFNAWDFEPLTGTIHLPPPVQQTFECQGFVICTFAPRFLDHHPQAIKVPYAHSNVQADEVLFYVDGQFGSRRGVGLGSMTLHPGGIPHGPHPGTIIASMSVDRTEEMAVMFDTERKLYLTPAAMQVDDPGYPLSWM